MKLLTKIGLGTVLCGAGLIMPSNVKASSALAHADYIAIQNAQTRAQVENDRIKLNCINDKLVLAKAVLNIIDEGDQSKVPQLHELRVAADACAGHKQVGSEGNNSFTSPPGAAEPGDTSSQDWGTAFEPPVNASPSMPATPRSGIHGFSAHGFAPHAPAGGGFGRRH